MPSFVAGPHEASQSPFFQRGLDPLNQSTKTFLLETGKREEFVLLEVSLAWNPINTN